MRTCQRGQAMVLIAMVIAALCGMLGLAIDGGRAFVDRREIQNAADAAVAAGATNYMRSGDLAVAEPVAVQNYMDNRSLGALNPAAHCSPGWQAPPPNGSVTFNCTFDADASQGLQLSVEDHQAPIGVEVFRAVGRQNLLTAIIQVLGGSNNFDVTANACAATGYSAACGAVPPVVLGLGGGCAGTASVTLSGPAPGGAAPSSAAVVGNVVGYGKVTGSNEAVAGDTTTPCGLPAGITSWCYPTDQAGPTCAGGALGQQLNSGRPAPLPYQVPLPSAPNAALNPQNGLSVNLSPGVDTTDPPVSLGNVANPLGSVQSECYFLAAGVYDFSVPQPWADGVISNELRPPSEPDPGSADHSAAAAKQFWNQNGAKCGGAYSLTAALDVPGAISAPAVGDPLPTGAYAVRITSVRTDNGVTRESAGSQCKTTNLSTPSALQVNISNTPGAQAYNIYLSAVLLGVKDSNVDISGGTCAGPFFLSAQIPNQNYVTETNADTSGCPSLPSSSPNCTLGVTVGALDLCQVDQVNQTIESLNGLPTTTTLPAGCPPPSPPAIQQPNLSQLCPNPPIPGGPPSAPGLPDGPPTVSTPDCGYPALHVAELTAPAGGNASLPGQDPVMNTTPYPDQANWSYCVGPNASSVLVYQTCDSGVSGYNPAGPKLTPGAVQWQETVNPLGGGYGCFQFQPSGGLPGPLPYMFSGYQYAWIVVLQPTDPNPACTDYFQPAFGGEFIGHVIVPQAPAQVWGTTPYTPSPLTGPTVFGCFEASTVAITSAAGGGPGDLAVYWLPPTSSYTAGYGAPVGSLWC